MWMLSYSLQHLVFFVLFFRSSINCRSTLKRELKNPETVFGGVFLFETDLPTKSYRVDESFKHQVPLQDLRSIPGTPDLNTDGFTYVSGRPVKGIKDLEELSDDHYDALVADSIELVKELTGAKSAFSYVAGFRDHTSPETPKPVSAIHSDLSAEGAEFAKQLTQAILLSSEDPEEYKFGRYLQEDGKNVVIVNVWRPIHTVQDHHLGICKWDSSLKEDAMRWRLEPSNLDNALQPWRYREGQSWWYLSDMRPDEAYVFMQHDSRAKEDGHGINVPHASFTFKKDANKPSTRMSFESSVIAIIKSSPTQATST
ncbi:uncharacterized protein MELLADRAFT_65847 [Melampsora larici-populina 98AG31]|uniref:Secreted protein n=1 Tax=Melampsora larici-populina (strain 98AG31 / pathotype 3-4-7) TaxID=747676 RepID=F4RWX3_MELLP|nr:uncharacterized protein MELLADRAFT_65847 [Melampsora larici-populina 98AG31]EGG03098.1 hypothetical protein MELLADRAFT_65847 [Melampsora larici-populina 98AG31]